jgi:hypothetical protein
MGEKQQNARFVVKPRGWQFFTISPVSSEDLSGQFEHRKTPLSFSASVQVGFDSKLSGNSFARMTKILFSFLALPSRIDGQLSCWCAELKEVSVGMTCITRAVVEFVMV